MTAGRIELLIISIIALLEFNHRHYVYEPARTFTEITKENGYESSEHLVTTDDGYQLSVFRMERRKHCENKEISTPVLLMHGLYESSDLFTDAGPNSGLAYLLPDACYDLWLGNTRGNYYARKHVRLDPDVDAEFWNFSIDEISVYDVPAKIDYMLNKTGASKINYIGYSQGGSIPLIMCLDRPEYCEKIGVIIGLAPALRLHNMKSIAISKLFKYVEAFEGILNIFGVYEILPRNGIIQKIAEYTCDGGMNVIRRYICETIISVLDSHNPGSISDDTLRSIFRHFPGGSSVRNTAKYGQVFKTTLLKKYDYGEEGNIDKYGSITPPAYNLGKVKNDVVLFQGVNDYLTNIIDNQRVVDELPNAELYIIDDLMWNHLDMVYSRHVNKTIFGKINSVLLKHSD